VKNFIFTFAFSISVLDINLSHITLLFNIVQPQLISNWIIFSEKADLVAWHGFT